MGSWTLPLRAAFLISPRANSIIVAAHTAETTKIAAHPSCTRIVSPRTLAISQPVLKPLEAPENHHRGHHADADRRDNDEAVNEGKIMVEGGVQGASLKMIVV
jgi:hypothetical protein